MLDFFVGTYVQQQKENFENNVNNEIEYNRDLLLVSFIISLFSAYLAWTCNKGENTGPRVFLTIIAYLFGGLYLLFYFIMYMLLGRKCN
jgi:hypothetical protein